MKINLTILLLFLMLFKINFAQNKYLNDATDLSVGVGAETNNPSYGVHSLLYYKDLTVGFTYILPLSSSTNDKVQEIKNGFTAKIGISPLQIFGTRFVFPIYLGFAYSYINEKSKVLEFTGSGKITATHFFIGFLVIPDKQDFLHRLGVHFEFGISNWNYNNSILKKNNANIIYNYPKFYSSVGIYYFIL
jgi:hypothetical protein